MISMEAYNQIAGEFSERLSLLVPKYDGYFNVLKLKGPYDDCLLDMQIIIMFQKPLGDEDEYVGYAIPIEDYDKHGANSCLKKALSVMEPYLEKVLVTQEVVERAGVSDRDGWQDMGRGYYQRIFSEDEMR